MSDFSVKAILSLVDKDFTAGFKKAQQQAEAFADGLKKTLERSSASIDAFKNNIDGLGSTLTTTGSLIGGFGMGALKSFGDLQKNINATAIVAGGTTKSMHGLVEMANTMGRDLPISANQAGQAMLGMAKNGGSIKSIKEQFPAIAKAATAAGADIDRTADAVMQSMNIWGGNAAQNAALIVNTANLSNASVDTMADAFANVGTAAKNLGYGLDTTGEAIGLLTNKGMNSARASMDLNHAFTQMIKPSAAAKKQMQELGLSYTDASGHMRPLRDILGDLNEKLAGYSPTARQAALVTMFGTAGMQAIAPLLDSVADNTGNAATSWDAYAKKQSEAAGTTEAATKSLDKQAKDMQKNVGSAIDQLKGSFVDLLHTSMEANSGMLSSVIRNIAQMIRHLQKGKDSVSRLTRSFIGMSPVIGGVMIAAGASLKALAKIIGILTSPFKLVATIAGVFAAQIAAAYRTSAPFRREISKIAGVFGQVFGPALKTATDMMAGFMAALQGKKGKNTSGFKQLGDDIAKSLKKIDWQGLANGAKNAISAIMKAIRKLMPVIRKLVEPILNFITQAIEDVEYFFAYLSDHSSEIAPKARKIGKQLYTIIKSYIDTLIGTVSAFLGKLNFKKIFKNAYKDFRGFFKNVSDLFKKLNQKKLFPHLAGDIGKIVGKILDLIHNLFTVLNTEFKAFNKSGAIDALIDLFKDLGDLVADVVGTIVDAINDLIGVNQKGGKKAKKSWSAYYETMGDILKVIIKVIDFVVKLADALVKTLAKPLKDLFKGVKNILKDVWDALKDLGKGNLFGAGKAVLKSFIDGLKAVWESGKDFIKGIAPWIKNHKGPISYDAVLLTPAGNAIMSGLNNGLTSGFKVVQDNISAMTDKISKTRFALPALDTSGVTGALDTINANASANVQGSISQRLDMVNQPAYISLGLGNRDYSAFVDDISRQQSRTSYLQLRR